jgi:hypothetical protein
VLILIDERDRLLDGPMITWIQADDVEKVAGFARSCACALNDLGSTDLENLEDEGLDAVRLMSWPATWPRH